MSRHFHASTPGDYSLDTIKELMIFLNNPQNDLRVVHVAGTSGKTSTAYYSSALLTAAGQKTGLTVSPHVDQMNERVQIDGVPLNEKDFCAALTEFLEKLAGVPVEPSHFEVMAAFAYWYFAKSEVDYAVIEVGLGGLLDGTNVVNRPDKVCVVTDIGFDHMHILGETLAEIAAQKIGIVQPGNVVFSFPQPPEVMGIYEKYCAKQHADLRIVKPPQDDDYRLRNWHLAYHVYEYLKERDGLPALGENQLVLTRQTYIPGRLDIRQINGKTLIMDGAHNPQKMKAFVRSFKKLYPAQKAAVLISLKEGKDLEGVLNELAPIAERFVATHFKTSQDMTVESIDPGSLAGQLQAKGVPSIAVNDQEEALQSLLSGSEEICVITGSFYLLGQLRKSKLLA